MISMYRFKEVGVSIMVRYRSLPIIDYRHVSI